MQPDKDCIVHRRPSTLDDMDWGFLKSPIYSYSANHNHPVTSQAVDFSPAVWSSEIKQAFVTYIMDHQSFPLVSMEELDVENDE